REPMTLLAVEPDHLSPSYGNSPADTGSLTFRRAARHTRVVAWLILVLSTSWPLEVMGQCAPLTCDTQVNGSIDSASEVDCFTFTAGGAEIVDITAVHLGDTSLRASWRLLDGSGDPVGGGCGQFGPSAPNYPCGLASGGTYRLEVK